jgi:hypothetical protein
MAKTPIWVTLGRESIARLADADNEATFAREVRAGCWDHRCDVHQAIQREKKKASPVRARPSLG